MDNSYKVLYSDIEFMDMSQYGDISSPTSLELFLVKQGQSKTNKVSFKFSRFILKWTAGWRHSVCLLLPPYGRVERRYGEPLDDVMS